MTPPVKPPRAIAVPLPLAQRLVDYLATRPYAEVCELIPALQRCEPVPEPADPPAPTPAPES